eukprot:s2246_g4.t1
MRRSCFADYSFESGADSLHCHFSPSCPGLLAHKKHNRNATVAATSLLPDGELVRLRSPLTEVWEVGLRKGSYRLVQNASNPIDKSDLIPACEARSKEWREIHSQVKRNALTYRYSLGQMVGRLKQ